MNHTANSSLLTLFAPCAPGLESMLAAEARELLGLREVKEISGGIEFVGDFVTVQQANLMLGLALAVRIRIETFKATNWDDLVKKVKRVAWANYVSPRTRLRVRASAQKSRLYHTGGIIERVGAVLHDEAGAQVSKATSETDDQFDGTTLYVRLDHDKVTLSLDTSGELLHRRGYREETAKAPLREDLARALLLVSQWDRRSPLLDPMCGSGTIPIEAAILASGRAPGALRRFAFETAPWFDAREWQELRQSAAFNLRPVPTIIGRDRDAGAVESSGRNAQRAGFEGIEWVRAAIRTPAPTGLGAIVTNPPWGERVGSAKSLPPLYSSLGSLIESQPDCKVGLVAANAKLVGHVRVALTSALLTDAGGKKVRLYHRA